MKSFIRGTWLKTELKPAALQADLVKTTDVLRLHSPFIQTLAHPNIQPMAQEDFLADLS